MAGIHDEPHAVPGGGGADHGVDARDHVRRTDALGNLLVEDDDIRRGGGLLECGDEPILRARRQGVEAAEVEAVVLALVPAGFGVDHRLPVRLRAAQSARFDAGGTQQALHLLAKKILSHDTDGGDLAHAQGREVSHHVAGTAEAIALGADAANGEAGLDGRFRVFLIEEPVGVEAEIAEDGDAGRGDLGERGLQPGRLWLLLAHMILIYQLNRPAASACQMPPGLG